MPNRPRIGITLGDPAGIGPEVVLKALRSGQLDRRFDYEIIGNPLTKHRADAVEWVVEGAKRCLAGELTALATGPITKELLHRAGYPFTGQTELLAHLSRLLREQGLCERICSAETPEEVLAILRSMSSS